MPVKVEDNGKCVVFDFAEVNMKSAEALWSSIQPQTVEFSHAAEIIVKRKMLELKFFYSGVGPDHGNIVYAWDMWMKSLGFKRMAISQRARDALEAKIAALRASWSREWKALGVWTELDKVNASATPSRHKRQKVDEGSVIKVASWALKVAQGADWDGAFAACPVLDADALAKAIALSHEVNQFNQGQLDNLKKLGQN